MGGADQPLRTGLGGCRLAGDDPARLGRQTVGRARLRGHDRRRGRHDSEYFQARENLDLIRTERLQDYLRARVRRLDDQHLRIGTLAEASGAAQWGLSNLVQATALYGSLLLVLWLVSTGRGALLRTGQVLDRLMIDLVRYRLDTLDVVGAPVAVAIGLWAAAVAGAWSPWSLLLVAVAVALPIALTAAVNKRGWAADDALRRQTMARTAMIQEVADAHDLYWARGRAHRGAARVRTDWDAFTAGPAGRTLRDWATKQQVVTTGPLLGSTIVLAGGAVLAAHGLMDAGSVVGAAVLVAPVQAALESVTSAIGSWKAREIVSRRLGWLVVDDDGTPAGGATVAVAPAEDDGASIETLELRGVSTLLPNGRRTTPVTADLSRGDVLWLRGGVGTGKTSLVRALIGLGADLDGEVLIDGRHGSLTPGQVLLMPQAPSFLSGTVTENIALDRAELAATAREGLEAASMGRLAAQVLEPGGPSLSGGERHVVAWLRHLRRAGGVRVLDEPFNGLSPEAAARVLDEIEDSRTDWITLLISHDDRPSRLPGLTERSL